MSKVGAKIAKQLDDCIIENFADIYLMEEELERIEKKHDLDAPDVIAAIATCADVASAQQRLVSRPPAALAKGLDAITGTLRPTAALMAQALRDGALREAALPAALKPAKTSKAKALPAFARPTRLPPPVDPKGKRASPEEVEVLVRAIAASKLGDPPDTPYTPASLAQLGRALALGWLSHGADPKQAWGTYAAAHFPDDATARDLGMMARELGPRVGQFSKAQVLVDAIAAMNTRAALAALLDLATKVKTKSVKDRARAAFDAAAKRNGVTEHDLADKVSDDSGDFLKRLASRIATKAKMPAIEFFENIMQRDALRTAARGVVFAAKIKSKLVKFMIDGDHLVGVDGKDFTLPSDANVVVVSLP